MDYLEVIATMERYENLKQALTQVHNNTSKKTMVGGVITSKCNIDGCKEKPQTDKTKGKAYPFCYKHYQDYIEKRKNKEGAKANSIIIAAATVEEAHEQVAKIFSAIVVPKPMKAKKAKKNKLAGYLISCMPHLSKKKKTKAKKDDFNDTILSNVSSCTSYPEHNTSAYQNLVLKPQNNSMLTKVTQMRENESTPTFVNGSKSNDHVAIIAGKRKSDIQTTQTEKVPEKYCKSTGAD